MVSSPLIWLRVWHRRGVLTCGSGNGKVNVMKPPIDAHPGPGAPLSRRRILLGATSLGAVAGLASCARHAPTVPAGDHAVDVLVIGAGIAGLAAAHALTSSDQRCVVLEARDRVGGRIWTSRRWPDLPVDLGASWIHGTDRNPIFDEANRFGIATTVFDVGSFDGTGSSVYYSDNGTQLDEDAVEDRSARVIAALERAADTKASGRTSLREAIDALPAPLRELTREPAVAAALTDYAGDYGATPDALALSALDEEDSFPGAQRVFPGGFGQLADRMAEGVAVRLNTPVTAVRLREDQVLVDAAGGQWTAAKVIVTVPLGVLKSGAIQFDPPLPRRHAEAIDRLGVGRFEKLVLKFDSAFWDDVDQIQVVDAPGAPFSGWYNLNRAVGHPALMALNGGAAAAAVGGVPVQRQAALASELLVGIYPGRFRPPLDAQATDWWADEFSRGSYSFTAVGSGERDREALGEPIGGRLWLAGEALHPTLHSTVHGAWLSGQSAASQAAG